MIAIMILKHQQKTEVTVEQPQAVAEVQPQAETVEAVEASKRRLVV
jgi:hypothetical protein